MPAVAPAEQYVYRVVDGYMTNTNLGIKLPISAFTLILAHNGIPVIRLNTVPKAYIDDVPSQTGDANVADLYDFIDWYDKLSEASEHRIRRMSNFYFRAESTGGDVQELNLEGWLMTAVGYGGLSASGAMQLSIELCHPAKEMNECSVNFLGLIENSGEMNPSTIRGESLFMGIVSTLALYAKSASNHNSSISFTEYGIMKEKFDIARTAFSEHLRWDVAGTGTWPSTPMPELANFIAPTLWDYVWSINSNTLWDWFMNRIAVDWFVGIRPTYWETTLAMAPNEPWALPSVDIQSDDVADITLPAAEPQNISGALALASHPILSSFTGFVNPEIFNNGTSDGAVWIESNEYAGAILPFQPPQWYFKAILLSQVYSKASSAASADGNNSNMAMNSTNSSASLQRINQRLFYALQTQLKAFAQEYFVESYRRMFEVSVVTRLMIQNTAREYIHPGLVQKITVAPAEAGGDRRTLLTYFATRVIHTVDCVTKQAYTQITGAYVRRASGPQLKAIPGGSARNILYTGVPGGGGGVGIGGAGGTLAPTIPTYGFGPGIGNGANNAPAPVNGYVPGGSPSQLAGGGAPVTVGTPMDPTSSPMLGLLVPGGWRVMPVIPTTPAVGPTPLPPT